MHMLRHVVQACQQGANYADVQSQSADLATISETELHYKLRLQCSSSLFATANSITDAAFCVDIVLNFLTGFVPPRSSEAVYDVKRIAKNYVSDTFFLDLVATIPWEQVRVTTRVLSLWALLMK